MARTPSPCWAAPELPRCTTGSEPPAPSTCTRAMSLRASTPMTLAGNCLVLAVEGDGDGLGPGDYVVVRDDDAARLDDHAGAGAFHVAAEVARAAKAARVDRDDSRQHRGEDRLDVADVHLAGLAREVLPDDRLRGPAGEDRDEAAADGGSGDGGYEHHAEPSRQRPRRTAGHLRPGRLGIAPLVGPLRLGPLLARPRRRLLHRSVAALHIGVLAVPTPDLLWVRGSG